MKNKAPVLNPFDMIGKQKISSVSSDLKSESSVDNSTPGICPKCRGAMTVAVADTQKLKSESVYWCASCTVVTPMPE